MRRRTRVPKNHRESIPGVRTGIAKTLREVAIEGDRSYFDTNTSNHFHFFDENSGELSDVETDKIEVRGLPPLPAGTEITGMDVIVRIRKQKR